MSLPIETERLMLRDYSEEDWRDTHEYASDPQVCRFMPWGPNTEDETRDFHRRMSEVQRTSPRLVWELAIELQAERRIIGGCGLRIQEPGLYSNPDHGEGDIGYVLNSTYWGQGFMTEAVRALLRFGFEHHGLHRIWATVDPGNGGSIRVLEKAGMRREGLLRANLWVRDHWRDSYLYAIVDEERRRQ